MLGIGKLSKMTSDGASVERKCLVLSVYVEMAEMSFCMPKTDFWSLGGPFSHARRSVCTEI